MLVMQVGTLITNSLLSVVLSVGLVSVAGVFILKSDVIWRCRGILTVDDGGLWHGFLMAGSGVGGGVIYADSEGGDRTALMLCCSSTGNSCLYLYTATLLRFDLLTTDLSSNPALYKMVQHCTLPEWLDILRVDMSIPASWNRVFTILDMVPCPTLAAPWLGHLVPGLGSKGFV